MMERRKDEEEAVGILKITFFFKITVDSVCVKIFQIFYFNLLC